MGKGKGMGMGKSEDWGRTKIGLPSGYKYHLEWQSYKDTD